MDVALKIREEVKRNKPLVSTKEVIKDKFIKVNGKPCF